jgi:hypothetical protein
MHKQEEQQLQSTGLFNFSILEQYYSQRLIIGLWILHLFCEMVWM